MGEGEINPEDWASKLKAMDEASGINREKKEEKPYSIAGDQDKLDSGSVEEDDFRQKKTLQQAIGYVPIPVSSLPTNGRFYPSGTTLLIKALTVEQVRHWSTVDDSQPIDVNSHLNQIILSCCTLKGPDGRSLGYKQICDADRLFILLSIRDLTYKEGEAKIDIPIRCSCGASSETKVPLSHDSIVLHEELEESIEKYYDSDERCFVIRSASHGDLVLHLPRIGVMEKVYNQISEYERQQKTWDKSFYITLPYLITNSNLLDDQKAFNRMYNDFKTWSIGKYSIYQKMIEKLKMGPTEKIKGTCSKIGCGAEVTASLTFPDGIRSLFLISNIESELL